MQALFQVKRNNAVNTLATCHGSPFTGSTCHGSPFTGSLATVTTYWNKINTRQLCHIFVRSQIGGHSAYQTSSQVFFPSRGERKRPKVQLRKHTHLTSAPTRSTNKIQVTNLLKRSIPTEEKQLKVHASKPSACPTSTSKKAIVRAQNLQEQNSKTS